MGIDGRSQQLPTSTLSAAYQVPIGVAGKSAEVVRKRSFCKHKRLPARRVYSMKHTAKCFKARLFRYHYRRGRRNNGMALWPWHQHVAMPADERPDVVLGSGPKGHRCLAIDKRNPAFGFRLKWRGLLIVRRIERKAEGRKPDLVLRLAQRLLRANRPNSQIEKDDRWL